MGSIYGGMTVPPEITQRVVPTTGQTIVVQPGISLLLVASPALIAALTITLPANPIDGQRVVIASRSAITVLTVNGGTVYGALGSLALSGFMRFVYNATDNAWYRIG
jgi:hypothetical protein